VCVSVIIPTYNRQEELIRAVDSVLNQTYQQTEIIVVDDGSSVKAGEILKKIDALNLKIIYQENKGPAAARNRGVEESSSEWLAFLDSDDFWRREKLMKQVEFHRENPGIVISQTDEEWIRKGNRVNPKKYHLKQDGDIFDISLKRCMISPSAVMVNRNLFEEIGGFDENLTVCEDYDLWLRITARKNVGFIQEKLVVKTGGHADQLSKKFWGMDRFRIQALEKILSTDLEDSKREKAFKTLLLKLKILAEGCKKRGKYEDAKMYLNKLKSYEAHRAVSREKTES
jgi:glycosyltransferase involved in cell wall biosynthesis